MRTQDFKTSVGGQRREMFPSFLSPLGCKMNNVNVVYTPWTNLKKTADMDVGQIGFHRQKDVSVCTYRWQCNVSVLGTGWIVFSICPKARESSTPEAQERSQGGVWASLNITLKSVVECQPVAV